MPWRERELVSDFLGLHHKSEPLHGAFIPLLTSLMKVSACRGWRAYSDRDKTHRLAVLPETTGGRVS